LWVLKQGEGRGGKQPNGGVGVGGGCSALGPSAHGIPLEAVHLQLLLLHDVYLQEELADVFPLVSLQLDHLPVLRVLNHSAIAGKFLFEGLHQLLLVVIMCDTLHSGKGFPPVPLLNPYVDFILCPSRDFVVTLGCISKGIESLEILDRGHAILGRLLCGYESLGDIGRFLGF